MLSLGVGAIPGRRGMQLRQSGILPRVTARAVTKGGGVTFSGAGVIVRPSVGKVVIAIETETESGDRSQWRGAKHEKVVRCSGCRESPDLR